MKHKLGTKRVFLISGGSSDPSYIGETVLEFSVFKKKKKQKNSKNPKQSTVNKNFITLQGRKEKSDQKDFLKNWERHKNLSI